ILPPGWCSGSSAVYGASTSEAANPSKSKNGSNMNLTPRGNGSKAGGERTIRLRAVYCFSEKRANDPAAAPAFFVGQQFLADRTHLARIGRELNRARASHHFSGRVHVSR